MSRIFLLVLVMMLTSCTGLSLLDRTAAAWVLDKLPEPQLNDSLTGDEQLEEEEELSARPTL